MKSKKRHFNASNTSEKIERIMTTSKNFSGQVQSKKKIKICPVKSNEKTSNQKISNQFFSRIQLECTEIHKKINPSSFSLDSICSETLAKIFRYEYEIRAILSKKSTAQTKKMEAWYKKKLIPLLVLGKDYIKNRPIYLAVQAAFIKGLAAQAASRIRASCTQNSTLFGADPSTVSDSVILVPSQSAVLKQSSVKSTEEEQLAHSILSFLAPTAFIGDYAIHTPNAEKLGIQISPSDRARAYPLSKFDADSLDIMMRWLSEPQKRIVSYIKAHPNTSHEFTNYCKIKRMKWKVEWRASQWNLVNFKDLLKRHIKEEIPNGVKIGATEKSAIRWDQHIHTNTPLFRALNYFPTLQSSPSALYFMPDLSHPKNKEAFEQCEKFKWNYKDHSQKLHCVSFKSLYMQNLLGNVTGIFDPDTSVSPETIKQAFHCPLKITTSQLILAKDRNGEEGELRAKPYMENIVLMYSLRSRPLVTKKIFSKLTVDSEYHAILMGLIQCFDLHENNIGFVPVSNPEYETYKDTHFKVGSDPLSFIDLLYLYYEGTITATSKINVFIAERWETKTLSQLPMLQKAFALQWQFAFFDLEFCLSENNKLHYLYRSNKIQHSVPFLSALLQEDWKDQPLSEITIRKLTDTDRISSLTHWIKKWDATIYKRLTPSGAETIKQKIEELLVIFSLTDYRQALQNMELSLQALKNLFIRLLCDMTSPSSIAIWKIIQEDLSTNPSTRSTPLSLDFTSSSEAAKSRRKRIASQLFPRLTLAQQNAFYERDKHCKEYLMNYRWLKESKEQHVVLYTQILYFLSQTESILSTPEKDRFLLILKQPSLLQQPGQLLKLKESILQICKPTYRRVIASMFPLLADALALNEKVYKEGGGRWLGHYGSPLETVISEANKKDPDSVTLIKAIENMIKTTIKPAFLGAWDF